MTNRLALVALLPALANAAPVTLPHAGYVLASGDLPLTQASASFEFALFDAPEAGTRRWPASGVVACPVDVAGGYYAVDLGSAECGTGLDSADLAPGAPRWLEVRIGGIALAPRQFVSEVAAAVLASRALDADRLGNKTYTEIRGELDGRYARLADGSTGPLAFTTTGPTALTLPASGTVLTADSSATITNKTFAQTIAFAVHGAHDLGSSAVRARDLWLSRDANVGGAVSAGSAAIGAASFTSGGLVVSGAGTRVEAPEVRGAQLVATAATGTSPFAVSSTTKVANLNADLWNGAKLVMPLGCPSGQVLRGFVYDTDGATLKADCTVVVQTRGTILNPGISCWDIRFSFGAQALSDAAYWVDPDGPGGTAAYEVYCDMNTDGGGWTLVDNDATNAASFPSRTAGANKDPSVTRGAYLPSYIWSNTPQLLVKSNYTSVGATQAWVTLNAVQMTLALDYPVRTVTGTSSRAGEWTVAKLNGNTDQGVGSWIYNGDTRFGSVWIGNGSFPTVACNYTGSSTGLGRAIAATSSTCSTWVR